MKKIKYIFAIITLFIGFTACDKQMEEMNTNPLALSEIPDEYLFTSALHQTFDVQTNNFGLRFGSQYGHYYISQNANRSGDQYTDYHNHDTYREVFENLYINPLRNINEVLLLTSDGKYKNPVRYAMAEIVAIISYAKATDSWGDVPYTEGAKGSSKILYPKYDEQEFIYHDMMEKLKANITVLKGAKPVQGYVGAEPVYNNDLTKWVRFANSLRLRLAMRARFVDKLNSEKVIKECLNEPLIETNDQNFRLIKQVSDNDELISPWHSIRVGDDWKMSEKFTNWLKDSQDPRLEVFIAPISSGERIGVVNGLSDLAYSQTVWNDYSSPMPALYSKSLSSYIMCASEIWFLRAEAALFNIAPGDANQLYRQGILSNMQLWNIDASTINNFLTNQPEATLNGSVENKFRQIGTQMWVAFVPNFFEAWTNIRRTGYPVIPQRTDPATQALGSTNGILPKRMKYATTEYLNNLENVNKAIAHQGPDLIDTPVWWDVKN
jgi:hypothetical protein